MSAIPDEYVDRVCKPGQLGATCAYLTLSSEWLCGKTDEVLKPQIEQRLKAGAMMAQGDNCDGYDETVA